MFEKFMPVPDNQITKRELIIVRGFVFSLLSGKNSYDLSSQQFMEGVIKFGLDSPIQELNYRINMMTNITSISSGAIKP